MNMDRFPLHRRVIKKIDRNIMKYIIDFFTSTINNDLEHNLEKYEFRTDDFIEYVVREMFKRQESEITFEEYFDVAKLIVTTHRNMLIDHQVIKRVTNKRGVYTISPDWHTKHIVATIGYMIFEGKQTF